MGIQEGLNMRTLIIGVPRAGKTTMARKISEDNLITMLNTDSLINNHEWSALSDKVCEWLQFDGNWVIEGCAGVRGLRKFLKAGHKVDFEIRVLDKPYVEQTGKQKAYGAACLSIWKECQQLMGEVPIVK